MRKNLISSGLLIVFCSVISFGQIKQNCSASEVNILDRQICNPNIRWKDSHIVWLLPQVFYSVNVPAGISVVYPKESGKETLQDFMPNSFVLREVLNRVITVQPQYAWKEENGVINIYPNEDYSVLETRIQYFKLENETVSDALNRIHKTSEFKNYIQENNLREEDTTFFGTGDSEKAKRFSFDLKNSTIREILNEIVKANGKGTWIYAEYESENNLLKGRKIYRLKINK